MRNKKTQKRRRLKFIKDNKLRNNTVNKKENKKVPIFNEETNYFLKYWEMYYENEYVLAKIKETVYEINNMQEHLDKLEQLRVKQK
jgi:hypothetical protein